MKKSKKSQTEYFPLSSSAAFRQLAPWMLLSQPSCFLACYMKPCSRFGCLGHKRLLGRMEESFIEVGSFTTHFESSLLGALAK